MTTQASLIPETAAEKPLRARYRLPVSLRIFGSILVAVSIAGASWIGVRMYAVSQIRADGGGFPFTPPATYSLRVLRTFGHGNLGYALVDVDIVSLPGSTRTDETLHYVTRLSTVQEVWLGRSRVTDGGLPILLDLRELHVLCLNDTAVTDDGLTTVANMTRLDGLDLGGTAVSNEGVAKIAKLHAMVRLQLDRTRITDAALVSLKGMAKLKMLSLAETAVTDDGLQPLSELSSLRALNLFGTRVTDAGIERLKLARLGLIVVRDKLWRQTTGDAEHE